MPSQQIALNSVGVFPKLFLDYISKKEKLEKLEAVLGVLSVVSLTSVYYLSDNKSLTPYCIPLGLALSSFTIGILNK